jgi:hypothetical protein
VRDIVDQVHGQTLLSVLFKVHLFHYGISKLFCSKSSANIGTSSGFEYPFYLSEGFPDIFPEIYGSPAYDQVRDSIFEG